MGPTAGRRRVLTGIVLAGIAGLGAAQAQAPMSVSMAARGQQAGELVVLTVTTAEPAGAVHVRAFDRDWPAFAVDERTWRVLIGIDLDVSPGEHVASVRVDSRAGVQRQTQTMVVAPKEFRTRTLTVDEAFVNPPEDVQARIAAEAQELGRLWRSSAVRPLWTGALVRPVPHEANSAFGSRSVFNGVARSPHSGADFASPAGTPVRAPGAGRVRIARDLYFTGGTVVIDHGAGLVSLFAHLSAMDVAPDATVAAGDVVGRVGATGRVTGAHLHWTVRVSGARVDPLSVLHVLGDGR
jgi:murein DD-endopeptidase MepM/ murein hydrolase activator NlpD